MVINCRPIADFNTTGRNLIHLGIRNSEVCIRTDGDGNRRPAVISRSQVGYAAAGVDGIRGPNRDIGRVDLDPAVIDIVIRIIRVKAGSIRNDEAAGAVRVRIPVDINRACAPARVVMAPDGRRGRVADPDFARRIQGNLPAPARDRGNIDIQTMLVRPFARGQGDRIRGRGPRGAHIRLSREHIQITIRRPDDDRFGGRGVIIIRAVDGDSANGEGPADRGLRDADRAVGGIRAHRGDLGPERIGRADGGPRAEREIPGVRFYVQFVRRGLGAIDRSVRDQQHVCHVRDRRVCSQVDARRRRSTATDNQVGRTDFRQLRGIQLQDVVVRRVRRAQIDYLVRL